MKDEKYNPAPGINANRMQVILNEGGATLEEQKNFAIALAQRHLLIEIGTVLMQIEGCPKDLMDTLRKATDTSWMESQI